jgi:hypothetical protein
VHSFESAAQSAGDAMKTAEAAKEAMKWFFTIKKNRLRWFSSGV